MIPSISRSVPDPDGPWPRARSGDVARRLLDLLLAGAGLVALAPVMLAVAVAIVVESGRPVFFVQPRLGAGGRVFGMIKFRKFGPAEGTAGCPLTVRGDGRMTRVGAVLARTKLDELPQLLNVLAGDMAVIGPRPESVALADCFDARTRPLLAHRPGLLGPSQVAFRSEADLYPDDRDPVEFYRAVLFPAKARLDLDYYERRSLRQDLAWFARGVGAVLRPAARP